MALSTTYAPEWEGYDVWCGWGTTGRLHNPARPGESRFVCEPADQAGDGRANANVEEILLALKALQSAFNGLATRTNDSRAYAGAVDGSIGPETTAAVVAGLRYLTPRTADEETARAEVDTRRDTITVTRFAPELSAMADRAPESVTIGTTNGGTVPFVPVDHRGRRIGLVGTTLAETGGTAIGEAVTTAGGGGAGILVLLVILFLIFAMD